MYGSKRSEPKSIVKNMPASMKLFDATPALPCASYFARSPSSASTWYASDIFWKSSLASSLFGFLSGCSLSAFL